MVLSKNNYKFFIGLNPLETSLGNLLFGIGGLLAGIGAYIAFIRLAKLVDRLLEKEKEREEEKGD